MKKRGQIKENKLDPVDHPPCNFCSQTGHNIKWKGYDMCVTCRQHLPALMREEEEFNGKSRF